jgi:hypothetical protein
MDRHILLERFRYITSIASLAYTFTVLHTLQYSMRDHTRNDNNAQPAQTPQDHDSTNQSTSTHNSPATGTTSAIEPEKSGSQNLWSENEVKLLLDYVEANCVLTTARGLNLKKQEFNKAQAVVKTKTAAQCLYKWGTYVFSSKLSIKVLSLTFHIL